MSRIRVGVIRLTVSLSRTVRQAEFRYGHVGHIFEIECHSVVGTRASKGRFPRADAIWLCDGCVWNFLGHLERDLRGIRGARVSCKYSFKLVTGLGGQDDLETLAQVVSRGHGQML